MIDHAATYKKFYKFILAHLILLSIALGLTMSFHSSIPTDNNWVPFIGRFHILLLHMPIGIFSAHALIYGISLFKKHEIIQMIVDLTLLLVTTSAVAAAILGFLMGSMGGYDAETLADHQRLGSLFCIALILSSFFRFSCYRKPEKGRSMKMELIFTIIAGLLLPLAGHEGGNLTHGKTFLTEYAPWKTGMNEENLELIKDPDLANKVQTIFKNKCYKCHGSEKQKGDYRMDIHSHLLAGGESELEAVIPHQPLKSFLVELITLPKDDDEVMPPEGKEQLTPEEVIDIIQWINMGAPEASTSKGEPQAN